MRILIPAKGKSSRIPRKNLASLIDGKSLLQWNIELFHEFFPSIPIHIATEDSDIIALADDLNCDVYPISEDDINDRRSVTDMLIEFMGDYADRPIILTHCTAPFTFKNELLIALGKKDPISYSAYIGKIHTCENNNFSQNLDNSIIRTGNFVIVRADEILDSNEWINPKYAVPVSWLSSIDINELEDLELSRFLAQRITQQDLNNGLIITK
jgi:CMP-N-acetylneuraminic acid synthetase